MNTTQISHLVTAPAARLAPVCSLLFLLPFCVLIMDSSMSFIEQSFSFREASPDPGGLPYRWILKSAIPLAFFLLFLQGIAEILKNLATLLDKS